MSACKIVRTPIFDGEWCGTHDWPYHQCLLTLIDRANGSRVAAEALSDGWKSGFVAQREEIKNLRSMLRETAHLLKRADAFANGGKNTPSVGVYLDRLKSAGLL